MGTSNFIKHIPCEKCGSSDANSLYDDGHTHCFSCNHTKGNNMNSVAYTSYRLPEGRQPDLARFKILPETAKLYRIHFDGKAIYFPYFKNNQLVGAKGRWVKDWSAKNFFTEGSLPGLFGMQTCTNRSKKIIITEGEKDTLAAKQMFGSYDVVSIANGAPSAATSLKKEVVFLRDYEEIVLAFDMDEVGQKAVEDALTVLPSHKTKVAVLPYKDAHECLIHDPTGREFREAIQAAKCRKPSSIYGGEDLLEYFHKTMANDGEKGLDTGYDSFNKLTGGFRPGEVITVVAGTGVGKTTFTLNLVNNVIMRNPNANVLFMPLEMSMFTILIRLAELKTGKRVFTPEGNIHTPESVAAVEEVTQRVSFYFESGKLTLDKMFSDMEFSIAAYNAKLIVLDHKDAVLTKLGDLDYKATDAFCCQLKEFAERNQVTVVLVSHQSRNENDKEDNKTALSRIRGSQGVAQNSDMVIGIERLRDSDVSTVRTLKAHRLVGVYDSFQLEFDKKSTKMVEYQQLTEEIDESAFEPEIQRTEDDNQRHIVQLGTGSPSTPEVSTTVLRSEGTEVREDVHTGLHVSEEERDTDVHRSEGMLHGNRPFEDGGSQEDEPNDRLEDSVCESEPETTQQHTNNERDMGGETRIQMGNSTDNTTRLAKGIVIDLEVNKKGEIVCVGYANDEFSGVSKKINTTLNSLLRKYKPIFHNAAYDVPIIQRYGYPITEWDDTILMANVLNSNRFVALKSLAQEYQLEHQKDEFDWKTWDGEYNETLADYCLKDVESTWELFKTLVNKMDDQDWDYYNSIDIPFQDVVIEMEKSGLHLDRDKVQQKVGEVTQELLEVEAEIKKYYQWYPTEKKRKTPEKQGRLLRMEGEYYIYEKLVPFNPASNDHKAYALVTEGVALKKMTNQGKYAVNKETIAKIDHPLARLFAKHAKLNKLKNGFLDAMLSKVDKDGYVRGRFNQTGTVTGRLSSSDPNLQNLDTTQRDVFDAPEGRLIVTGDLSNIEARILGYYLSAVCKDDGILNVYRNNIGKKEGDPGYVDLHSDNAKRWGITRPQAKTVLYLSMYGGGVMKLSENLNISIPEAKKILATLSNKFPALNKLKEILINRVKKKGYLTTLHGRKIYCPDLNSSNESTRSAAERQIFNYLIQGSAADIMKNLTVASIETAKTYGATFAASVHDEAVFYCPTETAKAFANTLTKLWTTDAYLGKFPIETKFTTGSNWKETK